jgi:hypothetical protein
MERVKKPSSVITDLIRVLVAKDRLDTLMPVVGRDEPLPQFWRYRQIAATTGCATSEAPGKRRGDATALKARDGDRGRTIRER